MATLNDKQLRFIDEYLVDCNATEAAKRAGYSSRSAHNQAKRLIRHDTIKKEIKRRQEAYSEKCESLKDRAIKELSRICFANMRDVAIWDASGIRVRPSTDEGLGSGGTITDDAVAAISQITQNDTNAGRSIGVKMHDKVRALELLFKHLGLDQMSDTEDNEPLPLDGGTIGEDDGE